MSVMPSLLDDDGYAQGRTSSPGNHRRAAAEACGRLEVTVKLEARRNGHHKNVRLMAKAKCIVKIKAVPCYKS